MRDKNLQLYARDLKTSCLKHNLPFGMDSGG